MQETKTILLEDKEVDEYYKYQSKFEKQEEAIRKDERSRVGTKFKFGMGVVGFFIGIAIGISMVIAIGITG